MECQCDKPVSKKLQRPRNVRLGKLRLRHFLQPPAWHRSNLRHLPLRRSRVAAAFVLAFHSRDEEISDVLTRSIDRKPANFNSKGKAGAVLLVPSLAADIGILGVDPASDGSHYGLIAIPAGGSRRPFSPGMDPRELLMTMGNGKSVFSRAVRMITGSSRPSARTLESQTARPFARSRNSETLRQLPSPCLCLLPTEIARLSQGNDRSSLLRGPVWPGAVSSWGSSDERIQRRCPRTLSILTMSPPQERTDSIGGHRGLAVYPGSRPWRHMVCRFEQEGH